MAKTNTIPAVQNVNNPDGSIDNAFGTAKLTVWTAGANDGVLKALGCTTTDTSPNTVLIYMNVGGASTDRLICTIVVAAGSGTDGSTATTDLLQNDPQGSNLMQFLSLDAYGNKVLNCKAGTTIKVAVLSAVTAAKQIDFFGDGGDF